MSISKLRPSGYRFGAAAAAFAVVAGLALSSAAPASAAVPDKWGFAYIANPKTPGPAPAAFQHGSWAPPAKVSSIPGPLATVTVKFPKIGSKSGVAEVTSVAQLPSWCQIERWTKAGTSELVQVRCHAVGGKPVFVPFTVIFTSSSSGSIPNGQGYAYLHYNPGSSPAIVSTFSSAGGTNAVVHAGPGTWVVSLPKLGGKIRAGSIQLSAVSNTKVGHCTVAVWKSLPGGQKIGVHCFNAVGALVNMGWSLVYQRHRAVTGTTPKAFGYVLDTKPGVLGPYSPPKPVSFNSVIPGGNSLERAAGNPIRMVTLNGLGGPPENVLLTTAGSGNGFCNFYAPWGTGPPAVSLAVACYSTSGKFVVAPTLVSFTGH